MHKSRQYLASHSLASNHEQSKKVQSQSAQSVPAVHSSSSARRSQNSVDRASSKGYYDIVIIGKTGQGTSTLGNKLLQGSPTSTEQMVYSTKFNRGVGALDKCGTFPRFYTSEDSIDSITQSCQLVANENTKMRVLDTPGFSPSYTFSVALTIFEANEQIVHCIMHELLDPNKKMSVKRLLYFLPYRGFIEKVYSELIEELKVMYNYFGRTLFNNMVVIATLNRKHQSIPFTEEDFDEMQTRLLIAIKEATDGQFSQCLPIVYIALDDSCDEVLHKIQTARVLGKDTSFIPAFHDTTCYSCASRIRFSVDRLVGVLYGDELVKYELSKCHPCFVPKYTKMEKIAGGIGHIATLGAVLLVNKKTSLPGFTNSEEICPVCKCPPGSPGCCQANETVAVKGGNVTVHHMINNV